MAEIYSKSYKLKIIGLRFFTVFGEWGRPDMFIMKYLQSFFNRKKFFLNNNGNHIRDFTYIKDVISIIIQLSRKKITEHNIYNICSNKPIHLKKIISYFNKNNIKPKIILKGLQISDILKTHGDNRLILREISNIKFTKTETAVENTINWYKKNKNLF